MFGRKICPAVRVADRGLVRASILVVNNKATNYCTTLALHDLSSTSIIVTRGTSVHHDNYLTTNIGTLGTCVAGNRAPRFCISCTGGSTTNVIQRSLLLAVSRNLGRIAGGLRSLKLIVLGSRRNRCITHKAHGVGVGNRGVGAVLTSTIGGLSSIRIVGRLGVASCVIHSGAVTNTLNFSVHAKATCRVQTGTILYTANNTTNLCQPGGPNFSQRGV